MPYEKQTWTTGDTITAEKLNHIEDGIENNIGYECETNVVNETITTSNNGIGSFTGDFKYVGEINALNELEVIFDGIEYTLPYDGTYRGYGESQSYNPSFVNYPLLISAANNDKTNWRLYTSTGGTHTIILPTVSKTEIVNIMPSFNTVVSHIIEEQSVVESFEVQQIGNNIYNSTMDFRELDSYLSRYHHMPICYYNGIPHLYTGSYTGATQPFYYYHCFSGFATHIDNTVSMSIIKINSSGNESEAIVIQDVQLIS